MKPYYDEDGITIYHADCDDILPTVDPSDVDLLCGWCPNARSTDE